MNVQGSDLSHGCAGRRDNSTYALPDEETTRATLSLELAGFDIDIDWDTLAGLNAEGSKCGCKRRIFCSTVSCLARA